MGEEGKFVTGWLILKDGSEVNCVENHQSIELNGDCLSDSDNDVKWDDCDDKLRYLFDQVLMVLLRGVYAKNGIRPIPPLLGDGSSVDLFKLFCLVRDRGGFASVSKEKLWGLIAEKFGFEYKLCASLKLIYFKYLDELDQWLNRITRDRISSNGSYECGGNLGLLSLELEKRFRNFWTDRKELIPKVEKIEYDEICKHIDVAIKETLHFSDDKKVSEFHNGVDLAVIDDDDKLCISKEVVKKENVFDIKKDSSSRKRKRDAILGMLSWMKKVAKIPCDPSIGIIPGCFRWKENLCKDFWSVALSLREARLYRRYADLNNDQISSPQKKHKMHPSMYEDDIQPNYQTAEGLRSSKRLLSLVNTSPSPCSCCEPCKVDKCKSESPYNAPPENGVKGKQLIYVDSLVLKKTLGSSDDDPPVEKHVLVGPEFQAEIPIWLGIASESDPKWLGTQTWSLDFQKENMGSDFHLPGKGRAESCQCQFPGSVECCRFHIAERRMKLRHELGLVFYHWKFDRMGEEVSLSWSIEEEKMFKHVIRLNQPALGKPFFPKKTWMDLVSYYYNVFLIRRRCYQNRVTPRDIDSDDDEVEFGSVSEIFGYNAVRVHGSDSMICQLNEQITDLD